MAGEYTLTAEEEQYIRGLAGARSNVGGLNSIGLQQANIANIYQNEKEKLIAAKMARSGNGGGGAGSTTASTSSSKSQSSSFSGIQDEETRTLIKNLINEMNNGGTAGQRAAKAAKDESIAKIDATMGDYSKQKAFQDATDLMALNLSKSMEANKPAIQKAVEGAGTSAGSMQALLSQKLATDSSMQAGALGAEQAKAYGQILTSLANTRGGLTNGVDQTLDPMTKLMDLMKIQSSQQTSESSATGYFSPQQMNVETQADKLAQIALQNEGALERTNAQVDAQTKNTQAQLDAQMASYGGGIAQTASSILYDPAALMKAADAGASSTSLYSLAQAAMNKSNPGTTQVPVNTTPAYMNINKTTPDANSSSFYDPSNYYYSEYEN